MTSQDMATRIDEECGKGVAAPLENLIIAAGIAPGKQEAHPILQERGKEIIRELKRLGWQRIMDKNHGKKRLLHPPSHAHTGTGTRTGAHSVEASNSGVGIPLNPLTPPSPPFPPADVREKNPELEKACLDLLLRWRVRDARDWIESLGPSAVAAEINAIKRDFPGFPDSEAVRRPGALMYQRLQQARDAQELMPQQTALDIVGTVDTKAASSYWDSGSASERGFGKPLDFDQAVFEESFTSRRDEHERQREKDEQDRLAALSGDPAYTKSAFVEKFVNGFGDAKRMPG